MGTPNASPPPEQRAKASLLRSGFPLQRAVAALVNQSSGWKVEREEFPWHDSARGDQYHDIVASNETGSLKLAIECKKSDKDVYTFLTDQPTLVDRVCCLYARPGIGGMFTDINNEERYFEPSSPETAFCVVSRDQSGADERLLEPVCRTVVRAADAYAKSSPRYTTRGSTWPAGSTFVPILVTNASLFVAAHPRSEVALDTGALNLQRCQLRGAELVRFCKPFISDGGRDVGVRTVLVVHTLYLEEFLSTLAAKSTDGGCLGHLG